VRSTGPSRTAGPSPKAEAALADAERSGFRLVLICRNAALAAVSVGMAYWSRNWYALALLPALLALGLLAHWALATGRHRAWHRYGLLLADVGLLALLALEVPLAAGNHEIPRIFLFRAYGVHVVFFFVMVTALTLSPRYVLTAGVLLFAVYWYVFYDAIRQMPETRSWGDLPVRPSAAEYTALLLDPRFIGMGNRVQESIALLAGTIVLAWVVHRTRRVFLDGLTAEEEKRRTETLFGRFVPAPIVRDLLEQPERLRPAKSLATVMFLDVEGFTRLAEGRNPIDVFAALQALLDLVADTVSAHGGTVISTAGDAALATFGAPVPNADHAVAAVGAAHEIIAKAGALRSPLGDGFKLRFGIATGEIAAGILGEGGNRAYTVYGDVVNVAQRLEASNKSVGATLTIDAATFAAAGGPEGFDGVEEIAVAGRTAPVSVRRFRPRRGSVALSLLGQEGAAQSTTGRERTG
jgi:adenylate cyclase